MCLNKRSTGLTCASGISQYVGRYVDKYLNEGCTEWNDLSKDIMIKTSEILPTVTDPKPLILNPPVLSLKQLQKDYQSKGDGTCDVFGDNIRYKVTHPISKFGLQGHITL